MQQTKKNPLQGLLIRLGRSFRDKLPMRLLYQIRPHKQAQTEINYLELSFGAECRFGFATATDPTRGVFWQSLAGWWA